MKNIYDLSWNEDSFLAKVSLVKKSRREVKLASDKVGVLSALSSTYYSVAGTAIAQLKSRLRLGWKILLLPVWFMSWLPLGAWCYWRMLPVSNKMLKVAGGYHNLSVAQCDIRQSILRKRGKLSEAAICIIFAIRKKPVGHSLALLLIGKADILERKGGRENFAEIHDLVFRVFKIAGKIESDEPQQAVRIYRHCADLFERMNEDGELLRNKAKQLAEQVGAKDQLAKL